MFKKIKQWVKPNDPSDRRLYRCTCGDLFWNDSPKEIKDKHAGHRFSLCINGSTWEFFKLKMGWIK
tara:strand:+ start:139 stop:336 length:198 start_codon:yes stop_codon:yes gene_type:complete